MNSGNSNILYQTPTGLWVTFDNTAYKLSNYVVSNVTLTFNRNSFPVHFLGGDIQYCNGATEYEMDIHIMSTQIDCKQFKKLTDLFSIADIKLLGKLINKKILDINEDVK